MLFATPQKTEFLSRCQTTFFHTSKGSRDDYAQTPNQAMEPTPARLDYDLICSSTFLMQPAAPSVTQAVASAKYGVARSWDNPLFEREYATREEAEIGHRETVARFTS